MKIGYIFLGLSGIISGGIFFFMESEVHIVVLGALLMFIGLLNLIVGLLG